MARRHGSQTHPHLGSRSPDTPVLIPVHLSFNEAPNADKISTVTSVCVGFLKCHVVALMTILTLTVLLRHIPLNVAFAVLSGLAVLGVDIIADIMLFLESITPTHWTGAFLAVTGFVSVPQG